MYDFQTTIHDDYCPTTKTAEKNGPLVGSISLDASPVRTLTNTQLTSVVSTTVDGHTVIIATTSTGRLAKASEACC